MNNAIELQGSLFEEDYLIRTLGAVAHSADVALTELVANAWDAGANFVKIQIPGDRGLDIVVEDDGCGMTKQQFIKRWMTLGYDRLRHQGKLAEFPSERSDWKRHAYGRKGIGRHGLLCFADSYEIKTRRDGKCGYYIVATSSGLQPFVLKHQEEYDAKNHGTILKAKVERNLPPPDRIRDILSARYLHDPKFEVFVNGHSVPLTEHPGHIDLTVLKISPNISMEVHFIDSTKAARTIQRQGIAFWVGNRLVGEPSWILGSRVVIDGRYRLAKRYTVVVKSDDLFNEVCQDWSAFNTSETMDKVYEAVANHVEAMFRKVSTDQRYETKKTLFMEHREEIKTLSPLARMEVEEFVDVLSDQFAIVQPENLTSAVKAIIRLEKSKTGSSLLEKLSKLSDDDIEGLDRLLSEWSIRDALTVLDEIDRRIAVIQAISKLSGDRKADELRSLHPLVTYARWLFGPEFDSPEIASNISLSNAVERVFKKRLDKTAFINPRKRPDLVVLKDASLSVVGTECFDDKSGTTSLRDILILELKRGQSTIGRTDMAQATDYVEDFLTCGFLDGSPFIKAFVVGHKLDNKIDPYREIGKNPAKSSIQATTYGQLVRTADKRLFKLRDRLQSRYEEVSGNDLLKHVLRGSEQLSLDEELEKKSAKK